MDPYTLMVDPSLTLAGPSFIPLTSDSFIVERGEPWSSSKLNSQLFISAWITKGSREGIWITFLFSKKSTSLSDISAIFLYSFEENLELVLSFFEASTGFEFLNVEAKCLFSDT